MTEQEYIDAIEANLLHMLQKHAHERWWNTYIPALGKTPRKMILDGEYERLLNFSKDYVEEDGAFF